MLNMIFREARFTF